ncbi:MAG: hypothetical protein HC910_19440 [Spirulinaceae cyanobacterium SM2_1_0]|nr:hypothetical protein [Spirulinaceae cyanobacterium SM2_1_0]
MEMQLNLLTSQPLATVACDLKSATQSPDVREAVDRLLQAVADLERLRSRPRSTKARLLIDELIRLSGLESTRGKS